MEGDVEAESGAGGSIVHHLSKRSRRNKGLVVVFDPAARKSFVTGFHKRKKKRRKIAEKQKLLKERQKRLEQRKERRLALKIAIGQAEPEAEDDGDIDDDKNDANNIERYQTQNGTVIYEEGDITTIVNTCSIDMSADFDSSEFNKHTSAARSLSSKQSSTKKVRKFKQHK